MDIVILLICTVIIINKLIKMLGQFDPEADNERREKYNKSFVSSFFKQNKPEDSNVIDAQTISAEELKLSEEIVSVLNKIRLQDNNFDFDRFINGVRKAYVMTIKAISEKDLQTLEFLMDSEVLSKYKEKFEHHENGYATRTVTSLDSVEMVEAALYGDRAVLTVEIKSHLQDDGEKNSELEKTSKVSFSRYLTQDASWKISKMHEFL